MAARASSLARICVLPTGETVPDYPCFSEEHEHKPNPEWWITEDRVPFKQGDRLFNYYDCVWGTVMSEPDELDGWFKFQDDGSDSTYGLNSVRVSAKEPAWFKGKK